MRRTRAISAALAWAAALTIGHSSPAADAALVIRQTIASRTDLAHLYQPVDFQPIWLDTNGTPNPSATDALHLLDFAAQEGLAAEDYRAPAIRALAEAPAFTRQEASAQAQFDVALSSAVLHYLRDLHVGRVAPRSVGVKLDVLDHGLDFQSLLRDAVRTRQLVAVARGLTPRGPQYAALAAALSRYRTRADGALDERLPFVSTVHPGDAYGAAAQLRDRLVLLGDMPAQASAQADESVYQGSLVDGVKAFQRRHGLEVDGALGKRTWHELELPLSWRVRQLELAMERLRWLPHEGSGRMILVNIPMFRADAWETIPTVSVPAFSTRVIVGRAGVTQTPMFAAALSEIIFRPYWNVPSSIVRKEVLPALLKEPGYLDRQHMELVAGQSDSSPVVALTPDTLGALRRGQLRVRQRPGPTNALGLIKFSFPNEDDVYMHATPAQALFSRARRDFSHGCVRVENPVGLAEWVLSDQPGWDGARIAAAMSAPQASRVAVTDPVAVLLLYSTAEVQMETGEVRFAEDIYGEDARLDEALRSRRID